MIGKTSAGREPGKLGMVRLDPETVRTEMGRRGWSNKDLSRESGVSDPTVAGALRGRPIRGAKARAIREAFHRCPPELDELTAGPASH
jgi:lambda repressor-like predicted transcriptional regulator